MNSNSKTITKADPDSAIAIPREPVAGSPVAGADFVGPPRFDILGFFRELRSRWWIIALCGAIGCAAGIAYLKVTPKRYMSVATVKVEQEQASLLPGAALRPESYNSFEQLKTVEQGLVSQQLLLRVVDANGLRDDTTFIEPSADGKPHPDAVMIWALQENSFASIRRGTRLIDIGVVDTDPERAQRIAASFVAEAYAMDAEVGIGLAETANEALRSEADRLGGELVAAEGAIQDYREEHSGVPLEESEDVATEKLKALNAEVTRAKSERLRLEGILGKLDGVEPAEVDMLASPEVAKLPEVRGLREEIAKMESSFAQLQKRYGPKHPNYIEAESQLVELQAALDRIAGQAGSVVERAYEAALATELSLEEALEEQKQQVLAKSRVSIQYAALVRERDAVKVLYEAVVKRTKEAGMQGSMLGDTITVFDPPMVPYDAISPSKKVAMVLGAGGGGALGLALALLLMLVDRNVRTVGEIESAIELPALASIPQGKKGGLEKQLGSSGDSDNTISEAFRTLRTALGFVGKGEAAKSFLFTSSREGEGKSYCASKFALTLARQGLRTLIVDGDLRRPSLDDAFFGNAAEAGLANHLEGGEVGGEACRETSVPGLYVLSAGFSKQNPGELLASDRLEAILADAGQWFHRIVIDSPPVNAVSDAILLAKQVDSVCLVVRAGKATRSDVIQATRRLGMAGTAPVGFVLNGVDADIADEYYGAGFAAPGRGGDGDADPVGRAARQVIEPDEIVAPGGAVPVAG